MVERSVDSAEGRRRGVVAVAVAVVLAALGAFAIVAYGGSTDPAPGEDFDVPEGVVPLGDLRAGSVASLVDCDDWNGGTVERQRATVVDVREQLSAGGTVAGRPSLTDQEAFDVFERACSNDFTGAFRLYKIYYDANAFQNLDPNAYSDQPGG